MIEYFLEEDGQLGNGNFIKFVKKVKIKIKK